MSKPEDGPAAPAPDDARSESEPAKDGGGRAAGGGRTPTDGDDVPLSQEDALRALRREAVSSRGQAESARMSAITDHLLERLQEQAGGLRIGTLALFNDSVRFGGGFNTATGSTTPGTGSGGTGARGTEALTMDWIGGHVDDFVRPDDFDRLLDVLCRDRILILARSAGSGREAMAVNLLAEALALGTGREGRMVRLGVNESFADPDWKPEESDRGLLVALDHTAGRNDRTAPERMVTPEWVDRMRRALQSCGSYLVVITHPPQGALLETAARTDVVATGGGWVDPVAIVLRRTLGEAPGERESQELLARLGQSGALDLMSGDPSPRTAVALASGMREGRDLTGLVLNLGDPSTRVQQWFADHHGAEEIGFALATAALHDARYLAVSDAAVTLHALLTEEQAAPPALRFHEFLRTSPWIVLVEPEAGERGHPRVRFREPRTQQAVLAYAWNHLDGQRTALVRWLRHLVTHRDVDVQARACVATAVVVAQDLEHALHRFIDQWAGHPSVYSRRAAGTILGVVSEDPEWTEEIWDLLYTWADRPGTVTERRKAATSALVAGGPPGRRDPESAMDVLLAALGEEDSWDSLTHVAEAMTSLVGHGRTAQVLAALLDWSAPQDASPLVLKSLLSFCYVAGAATVPEPAGTSVRGRGRGRRKTPPLLLDHSEQHLRPLAELWKRALARKPVQEVALDVLRGWVEHADAAPGGRAALLRLLTGVAAGGDRHRERLRYWLGRWSKERGEASAVAVELLHAI